MGAELLRDLIKPLTIVCTILLVLALAYEHLTWEAIDRILAAVQGVAVAGFLTLILGALAAAVAWAFYERR